MGLGEKTKKKGGGKYGKSKKKHPKNVPPCECKIDFLGEGIHLHNTYACINNHIVNDFFILQSRKLLSIEKCLILFVVLERLFLYFIHNKYRRYILVVDFSDLITQ